MFSAWFFTQVGASIVVLTVLFYILAYAGLFVVRFTLNAEKWPSFYDFKWLEKKLWKVQSIFVYCGYQVCINKVDDGFTVTCGEVFSAMVSHNVYEVKSYYSSYKPHVFSTYEEALAVVKRKYTERVTAYPYGLWSLVLLPIGVALDVVFLCLSYEPVATISVLGTISTILAVRWLSGKAADTAKKVMKHEDDINELKSKS